MLPITEAQFLAQVRQLAQLTGWLIYHPWISIHSPHGFPDLFLCRPPRIIMVELKSSKGKLTTRQAEWLDALRACPGIEVYLWRPTEGDWPQIEEVLR